MEILSESLVYYAARNSETGKYKATRECNHLMTSEYRFIKLYKNKESAEKYGLGCDEVVKMKVVRIA